MNKYHEEIYKSRWDVVMHKYIIMRCILFSHQQRYLRCPRKMQLWRLLMLMMHFLWQNFDNHSWVKNTLMSMFWGQFFNSLNYFSLLSKYRANQNFKYDNIVTCWFFSWVLWSNGLVPKALDSQFRDPAYKITEWLQGRFSLSSFRERSNEYQQAVSRGMMKYVWLFGKFHKIHRKHWWRHSSLAKL